MSSSALNASVTIINAQALPTYTFPPRPYQDMPFRRRLQETAVARSTAKPF